MFLSTIRQRVANHGYRSADEFNSDVSKLLDSIPKASSLFKDKVTWQSIILQHCNLVIMLLVRAMFRL